MGYLTTKSLYEYYNKLKNPTYILKDWVIVNDSSYIKHKNKLTIINILSRIYDDIKDETILVFEDKNLYYAIKYNDKFICLKPSETEYGLVVGDYELLAINKHFAYSKNETEYDENKKANSENLTIKYICSLLGWKLSKRAKEYLD